MNVTFATDFGDLNALDVSAGGFQVALSLDGSPYESSTWFGRAGLDPEATDQSVALRMLTVADDGSGVFMQLNVPASQFAPGSRPLYALESFGVVTMLGEAGPFVGFVSEGTLELDSASALEGAPVSGRLTAQLVQLGCAR